MHKLKYFIFGAALLCIPSHSRAETSEEHRLSIRIHHIELEANMRIIGIKIKVMNSSIESLSKLPSGWYVDIENNPMPYATLSGNIVVGSAAIDSQQLENIHIYLNSAHNDNTTIQECTISVTNDFHKFHEVDIKNMCEISQK